MKLPKARTENLLEQNLERETLIYDLVIDKAFNLNETLSVVYKACGRNETFDNLRREHKFSDEFIYLALEELKKHDLLAGVYESPFAGMKRREVVRKIGLASFVALPVISYLVAPPAANASSGRVDNGVACGSETLCKVESRCTATLAITYNTATDSNSFAAGGNKCCTGSNSTTGSYRGGSLSGFCNFAGNCCTGTGTESYNAPRGVYYCTCSATS